MVARPSGLQVRRNTTNNTNVVMGVGNINIINEAIRDINGDYPMSEERNEARENNEDEEDEFDFDNY